MEMSFGARRFFVFMEKEDWGKLKIKDEDWYSENRHRFFI